MTSATNLFRPAAPSSGALRIDPLVGQRPSWREGDAPIFDALVAELGDPYLPGPPPSLEDDAEADDPRSLDHLVEALRAVDLGDQADRLARTLGGDS